MGGSLPVLLDDGARKYVHGLGLAYTTDSAGTIQAVYHADGLGSVRALTDAGGAVVQTYQTDEFGVPTATAGGSGQPFGYTGEQRDGETGLVYLRARLYDATIGRFVQRDPIAGHLTNPQSLNRYVYALNNPLRFIDPTGHYTVELRFAPVIAGGYHAYILVTEDNTDQYVFRAGPANQASGASSSSGAPSGTSGWGNVVAFGGEFREGAPDWGSGYVQGPTLMNRPNESGEQLRNTLMEYVSGVTNAQIPYHVFDRNSNSFAYSALRYAGIPQPAMRGKNYILLPNPAVVGMVQIDDVWVPGWGVYLAPRF